MMLAFDAHDNALGVDRIDDAVAAGQNNCARVTSRNAFHPGADDRRLRSEQRHGLALHVRAHQRAVRVVVLEERYQRGRNRNQLLRADVDVIDFFAIHQHEVAGLASIDEFGCNAALIVEFHIGLRDRVAVFFPSRQIERERLDRCRLLALLFQLVVDLLDLVLLHVIADFEVAIANVHDA